MKIDNGLIIFSTGKQTEISNRIIGLSTEMEVAEGYDAYLWRNEEWLWRSEENCLTDQELVELSDYMIDQWMKFREIHLKRSKMI